MFQIEKVHKSHPATALFPAIYSLTPNPSPNGTTPPNLPQGEECLTGASYEEVSLIQRGHLFDAKEGFLQCEETPSSIGERRFLVFVLDVPVNEVLPRYTETILHGYFSKALLQTELIIILNFEL